MALPMTKLFTSLVAHKSTRLLANESHASLKNDLKNNLVFILVDHAFFCLSNQFWKGHRRLCKDERWALYQVHITPKCHYTAQTTIHWYTVVKPNVLSNVTLSCFRIFPTCPFSKNTGNLVCESWKQSFSWPWNVVFISNCCRPPTVWNLPNRLQLPDCTVTHGFADSHWLLGKKHET